MDFSTGTQSMVNRIQLPVIRIGFPYTSNGFHCPTIASFNGLTTKRSTGPVCEGSDEHARCRDPAR